MARVRNTTTRDRHRAAIARGRPPCGLCGEAIDYSLGFVTGDDGVRRPHPMMYVVDHVDPNGPDTLANKQAAHWRCNRTKSDRLHSPIIRRSGALIRPLGGIPPSAPRPPFPA